MITFSYTPLGGTGVVNLALLDSDRYWPSEMGHDAQGILQPVHAIRAASARHIGRGLVTVPISFPTHRVFANRAAAYTHCFIEIPKAVGQGGLDGTTVLGTLTIQVPGGGRVRSIGAACLSAPARLLDVSVATQWTFLGPQLTPG